MRFNFRNNRAHFLKISASLLVAFMAPFSALAAEDEVLHVASAATSDSCRGKLMLQRVSMPAIDELDLVTFKVQQEFKITEASVSRLMQDDMVTVSGAFERYHLVTLLYRLTVQKVAHFNDVESPAYVQAQRALSLDLEGLSIIQLHSRIEAQQELEQNFLKSMPADWELVVSNLESQNADEMLGVYFKRILRGVLQLNGNRHRAGHETEIQILERLVLGILKLQPELAPIFIAETRESASAKGGIKPLY